MILLPLYDSVSVGVFILPPLIIALGVFFFVLIAIAIIRIISNKKGRK